MRFTFGILILVLTGCSLQRQHNYPMPYLNSIEESKRFTDSLRSSGIDQIIVYHKKHGMSPRDYFIFWFDTDLHLRQINATGIFKLNSWEMIGFYRGDGLFNFFKDNQIRMSQDSIPEDTWSHYPYSDIEVILQDSVTSLHLPNGIQSSENSGPYQFARLIESTLFNIERKTIWVPAEKKMKYYPKNYDPNKLKWQEWRLEKISKGEIWDD
ncbi:hypothetical protein [Croceimicrobium hydrocarbonivorans]|uniref:Lipoprotein n=1 Tax=Croceimicrobium hydrocarbonivorans TaxID=2761580 RepID=A0A7H0VFP5_9FLAO|nr:hypothetical protein [Croceimicrobium hydrocarbonivorans]QNR24543.1 hypothetical protein H4K34_01500 [Croceimicrobium hydrocarbonivorans]